MGVYELHDLLAVSTNLQATFDAEQLAISPAPHAIQASATVLSGGALGPHQHPVLSTANPWQVPVLKSDMRFPFKLRNSVDEMGQQAYDALSLSESQHLLLSEKTAVELHRPGLKSADVDMLGKFLAALPHYYEQGRLKPFRLLIDKDAQKQLAPILGRNWARLDDRELLYLLAKLVSVAEEEFSYKRALKRERMTNSVWSRAHLNVYFGEQTELEETHSAEVASIKVETQLLEIWHGLKCETFKARMKPYVTSCASSAEFRQAGYKQANKMDSYDEIELIKSRGSGKSSVPAAGPPKPSTNSDSQKLLKPKSQFEQYTPEERHAHYLKKRAGEQAEAAQKQLDDTVKAVVVIMTSQKKASAAAVPSSPPDPPLAVCINCDKPGHPPWQCKMLCSLSICQAAPKRAHKACDCPYYKQMASQDADRITKPSANEKKSAAANALMQAALDIVDTTHSDDEDDPWGRFNSLSGY
jgi:hypothetical protein